MGISITHNLVAMNAGRMFSINSKDRAKSTEKLSSGYKINRSADDAAGLAISEKMRRQIRGLSQGVENAQEGIGVCQVADGALAEVNAILHRITELSVKAANGTNSESDRQTIQQEIHHLLAEIDRIGDTTEFNQKRIFQGADEIRYNSDGTTMAEGDIPFSDFVLSDVDLGHFPFEDGSGANHLQLEAIVDNPDSIANGKVYRLIYGNGSTSSSSIRFTYEKDGQTITSPPVAFGSLEASNYISGTDITGNPYWSRDFVYTDPANGIGVKITQKVVADDSGTDEKNYHISYSFENTGTTDVSMDFMFHVDTAYNENDTCEGYFANGNRMDTTRIYSESGSPFTDGYTNNNIYDGVPDSFSIVDVNNALAFSEKISFPNGKPDSLSVGLYHDIDEWSYYDSLGSSFGHNAIGRDLGFSLLYNLNMTAGNSKDISFDYGIAATGNDANLQGVPLQKNNSPVGDHYGNLSLWIHSGAEAGVGQWLQFGEMNTKVLGINRLDASTVNGAEKALDEVKGALKYISRLRGDIGAQQNRLEHTINNEKNIVENTISSESSIRDTDMATELVRNANLNILQQAAQSVLSQANQQSNHVLSLLQ